MMSKENPTQRRTSFGSTGTGEKLEHYLPAQRHLIYSKYVRQSFQIDVMQPAHVDGEVDEFPVVYATDGNLLFDALKGISISIQRQKSVYPKFTLVGVGYPGDCPFAGALLRTRDLTFPGYPIMNPSAPAISGVLKPDTKGPNANGASSFQLFIEHELAPFIEETYSVRKGDRTFFGHSAGASFGLFTLFSKPSLFQRYIISSPALSYDGETSAGVHYENNQFMTEHVRNFRSNRSSILGAKVYMSVGAEEEAEPELRNWKLKSSFDQFVAYLTADTETVFEMTTEIFLNETHMTVWPLAFIHGIRSVFPSSSWQSGRTK